MRIRVLRYDVFTRDTDICVTYGTVQSENSSGLYLLSKVIFHTAFIGRSSIFIGEMHI